MQHDEDHELKSVKECRQRIDLPKRIDAIQVELASIEKWDVFRLIVCIPESINSVGVQMGLFTKAKWEK